ncbi:hypothetical protein FLX07_03045 [Microbispora bryophytorum]|nr:hypothetical protein FLX07_03045 [Microbispora bryophytorum]
MDTRPAWPGSTGPGPDRRSSQSGGVEARSGGAWPTGHPRSSSRRRRARRPAAIISKSLTLNGASFPGLRQNGVNLANGADYTVSANTLTLTAAALTRLAGNRS